MHTLCHPAHTAHLGALVAVMSVMAVSVGTIGQFSGLILFLANFATRCFTLFFVSQCFPRIDELNVHVVLANTAAAAAARHFLINIEHISPVSSHHKADTNWLALLLADIVQQIPCKYMHIEMMLLLSTAK